MALAAVVWALADLERFALVAVLPATAFPQALLQPGGAHVAAADLMILLALGVWLARAGLRVGPALFVAGNPVFAPCLLFVAVAGASLAWSVNAPATVKMTVQLVELVIVVPLLFASVPSSFGRIREGLLAYVAVTAALAGVVAVRFGLGAAAGEFGPQYLGGVHKNSLGSFIGVGLVLAYALSLERGRSLASRRLLAVAALVELAGLYATMSRGALVGAFVSVLALTLVLCRGRLRAILLVALASSFFLLAIQARSSASVKAAGGYETTLVRQYSYTDGIRKIKQAPFLGTGAGTYWDAIPQLGGGLSDPNNLFLLTWAELGLAGMAALLFLLYRYARMFLRARALPDDARTAAVAAGAGALSLLVHFQFDVTWTRGTATACFALIGMLTAAFRLARPAAAHAVAIPVVRPAARAAPVPAAVAPLHVLQVVTSERFAGIERHVLGLARGLRARGVECVIACSPGAERLRKEAATVGVPVTPPAVTRRGGWFSEVVNDLAGQPLDVVHVHDGNGALAAWRLATRRGTRFVRTQHFVRPASVERTGWRRAASLALHRTLNDSLDMLVAVSESVASATRERREVSEEKIAVILPGVPVPDEEHVRRAVADRRRTQRPIIAYVGRLEHEKAPSLLLDALARLLKRVPECRLLVVGSGTLEESLRERARQLNIEGAVSWLGELADPTPVFERAHVLVNPSSVEGFGLAVVEGMGWALPVVGMRAGGVGETVVDGATGLLVDREDPLALADAIASLLHDRRLAESLGAAGRVRARERYGVDSTVELTKLLYERLRATR